MRPGRGRATEDCHGRQPCGRADGGVRRGTDLLMALALEHPKPLRQDVSAIVALGDVYLDSFPCSGTTSLIFGERPSVRFPSRTVPIWVSDPMGLAKALRMACTPAMNVVLTAPRPTSNTPSLPRAGAMSTGADTGANYISFQQAANSSQLCGIEIAGRLFDVYKYRSRSNKDDHFRGGNEAKGRRDDFVPRFDAKRHQGNQQRVGPACRGDALVAAGKRGKPVFELGHFGAENELPMFEHALNALVGLSGFVFGFLPVGLRSWGYWRARQVPA